MKSKRAEKRSLLFPGELAVTATVACGSCRQTVTMSVTGDVHPSEFLRYRGWEKVSDGTGWVCPACVKRGLAQPVNFHTVAERLEGGPTKSSD